MEDGAANATFNQSKGVLNAGTAAGGVWGSNVQTDDSALGWAAVHAGVRA